MNFLYALLGETINRLEQNKQGYSGIGQFLNTAKKMSNLFKK